MFLIANWLDSNRVPRLCIKCRHSYWLKPMKVMSSYQMNGSHQPQDLLHWTPLDLTYGDRNYPMLRFPASEPTQEFQVPLQHTYSLQAQLINQKV
jgi:hypothetical protein